MLMGVQNLCWCSFSVFMLSLMRADTDEPGSSADMRPAKKTKRDHSKRGTLYLNLCLVPAFTLMHMCDLCVYEIRWHLIGHCQMSAKTWRYAYTPLHIRLCQVIWYTLHI